MPLLFVYLYLGIGLVAGLVFVFFLAHRADTALAHAPLALRLLLLPASVFLWPWVMFLCITKIYPKA